MKHPAWRIYHNDVFKRQEITQSQARVKAAQELGCEVVHLVEFPSIAKALDQIGYYAAFNNGELVLKRKKEHERI